MIANSIIHQSGIYLPTSLSDSQQENYLSPLPYQVQEFKSSTVLKTFEPEKRILDSQFLEKSPNEYTSRLKKPRSVIVHSDRYKQTNLLKRDDSQKVRLQHEEDLLEAARNRMRLRDALIANRTKYDLQLGGCSLHQTDVGTVDSVKVPPLKTDKVKFPPRAFRTEFPTTDSPMMSSRMLPSTDMFHSFSEWEAIASVVQADKDMSQGKVNRDFVENLPDVGPNFDSIKMDGSRANFNTRYSLQAELNRLRALVLPDFAKDLYIGRGIALPGNHALNKPRRPIPANDPILQSLIVKARAKNKTTSQSGNIILKSQQHGDVNSEVQVPDLSQQLSQGDQPVVPSPTTRLSSPTSRKSQTLDPLSGVSVQMDEQVFDDIKDVNGVGVRFNLSKSTVVYLKSLFEQSSLDDNKKLPVIAHLGNLMSMVPGDLLVSFESSQQHVPEMAQINYCLELFQEIDREGKGCISVNSLESIAGTVKQNILSDSELDQLRSYCSTLDTVDKLHFLCLLPFINSLCHQQS